MKVEIVGSHFYFTFWKWTKLHRWIQFPRYMYSVLRVVLHDTFDYSTAPFSRDAGQLDHLSSITRFNLRLHPTSRGRKNRFFFYLEKRKEVVTISDLRESSGGRFAATAHVEARFSCYFHILFTSRTLQNSHVKAFCFRKIFAHGKIKSGRKSLVKKKKGEKKRKGTNLSRKEKTSSVKVTGIGGAPSWRPDFKQRSGCQTKIYHT